MSVEEEDSEQPRKLGEVAVDDFLEIGNSAEAPVFELYPLEEAHADEDFDGSDDLTPCEDGFDGADDPRVEGIVALVVDAHRCAGACLSAVLFLQVGSPAIRGARADLGVFEHGAQQRALLE